MQEVWMIKIIPDVQGTSYCCLAFHLLLLTSYMEADSPDAVHPGFSIETE